jgi:hypothetical protein
VWRIQPLHDGSFVTLCATVDAASPPDALLLRFGARRWLAGRFAAALEHLSQELGTVSARSGAGAVEEPLGGPAWGVGSR